MLYNDIYKDYSDESFMYNYPIQFNKTDKDYMIPSDNYGKNVDVDIYEDIKERRGE